MTKTGILLDKVLKARGLEAVPPLTPLAPFSSFVGIDVAAERIHQAIDSGERIFVYGDYDCDGITATAIILLALRQLGARNCNFHLPDRLVDGYGITPGRVEEIAKLGYHLIITVDNGIAAHPALQRAQDLGVDVIVTDHHQMLVGVPPCLALLHPQYSEYTNTPMSGGFVAFALASHLLGYVDSYLLALAAISTISDVMPLVDENRYLVARGLEIMNAKQYPALVRLNGAPFFTASSLGSPLASTLNAAGRIGSVAQLRQTVSLLLADDEYKIETVAQSLDEINQRRKSMVAECFASLEIREAPVIVVYRHDLHEGIIGLLATMIANKWCRPAIVMCGEGGQIKGSIRGNKLLRVDLFLSVNAELFTHWGGHAEAGGFSLEEANLGRLYQAVSECHLGEASEEQAAIEVEADQLSDEEFESLQHLGPFGQGNPAPQFVLNNVSASLLTARGDHLFGKLGEYRFVGFGLAAPFSKLGRRVNIIFVVEQSYYRGRISWTLMVKDAENGSQVTN